MSADLAGHVVAVSGRMASMTRRELEALVAERGGAFARSVTRGTTLLVIGQEGLPLSRRGEVPASVRRARRLAEEGAGPEILGEDEFLRRLDLAPEGPALFTVARLSRILDVPGRRIRSWVRRGILAPTRSAGGVDTFDFRRVAAARAVADLVEAGVSPERIRESLAEVARWLPGSSVTDLEPDRFGGRGRLAVRREDGALADPAGQMLFDFDAKEGAAPIAAPSRALGAEDWFQEGLEREGEGDVEAAATAYGKALEVGGREPETCLNLGNALYALGRKEEAAERFREAVDLDPAWAEAWNNLGNALAETGRPAEAVTAFGRALALAPRYADAHLNLAETLLALGRRAEAVKHWRAYLREEPRSSRAPHVRRRLSGR